jgi:uncharacterized protein YegP (UPF0339 family)
MAPARFQLFTRLSDRVDWRFVASNNREIARGDGATDERLCRELIDDLKRHVSQCRPVTYQDQTGGWRWELRVGGQSVAASSRWYHRRVECESTVAQFVYAAPSAPVLTAVKAFRSVLELPAGRTALPHVTDRIVLPLSRATQPRRA